MRFVSSVPARQLRSVSNRHRHSLGQNGHNARKSGQRPPKSAVLLAVETSAGGNPKSARPQTARSPDSSLNGGLQQGEFRDHRLADLEAVLFVSKVPLHTRKLSQYANLADGTEARTLIHRLNQTYDLAGRAFRVIEVAGGWQLRTRRQFANWLRRLPHVPKQIRLSAPSMETLAVIAYRQPVIRADVELVRGVACGEIIRQLMDRDLVRVAGRSEELGRPFIYSTTKRFLEVFGLRNIEELPRAEWIKQQLENAELASPAGENEIGESAVTLTATLEESANQDELTDPSQVRVGDSINPKIQDPEFARSATMSTDESEDEWEEVDGNEEEEDDDYEYEDVEEEGEEEEDDGDEWEEVEVDDDGNEIEGDDLDDSELDDSELDDDDLDDGDLDDDDLDDDEEWEDVEEGDEDDDEYEYEEVEVEVDDDEAGEEEADDDADDDGEEWDDDEDEYEYEEVGDDDELEEDGDEVQDGDEVDDEDDDEYEYVDDDDDEADEQADEDADEYEYVDADDDEADDDETNDDETNDDEAEVDEE